MMLLTSQASSAWCVEAFPSVKKNMLIDFQLIKQFKFSDLRISHYKCTINKTHKDTYSKLEIVKSTPSP